MQPLKENHQDANINEVPAEVWHENAAKDLPSVFMEQELRSRGYGVIPPMVGYDDATGLITDGNKYWTTDGKQVDAREAYKRATRGW